MIETLALQNWRAYEQLELKLQPGVTFIVAPNGVGKSSIIEGARFALYGVEPNRGGHRKAGALGQTSAAVTLRLDDGSALRIHRVAGHGKNSPVTTAELDGQTLSSDELDGLLRTRFGAPLVVLDRLSMIHGSDVVASSDSLDLRAHLSDFLGVNGLDRALIETGELLKEAEEDVKRHRAGGAVSRAELRRLETLAEQADARRAEIEQQLVAAQGRLTAARAATREAERVAALMVRAEERDTKLRRLAEEASTLLGPLSDVEELSQALADADEALRENLDVNRRQRAELDGRMAAANAQLAELSEATGTCPVCRRPLDPADVTTAQASHEAEIAEWKAERVAIVDDELNGRLDFIARARSELAQLGPTLEIASGLPELDLAKSEEAAAASAYDAAANEAVIARAEAGQALQEHQRARTAASALDAVTEAYGKVATLEAVRDALATTRSSLLEQGIEPLADSLDMHWSQLFRNRPGLVLAGSGDLTRAVGDAALVSSQFSDGERMVAQLLLRLLVLKATTRLPFMWIDEPLEHLDPDTRRALSLLLTSAPFSDSAGLRQVVMTTYEEPLVRRLRAAIPNTHVCYVRPAA